MQNELGRKRSKTFLNKQHGRNKGQPAQNVHPQGALGIGLGLVCLVMPYEHEGTQRCDFPEQEHPGKVVAEHQAVHGAEEAENNGKKSGLARNTQMQMLFVQIHVAHAVNGNKPANHADDDHHDKRQTVCHKGSDGHFVPGKNEFKV